MFILLSPRLSPIWPYHNLTSPLFIDILDLLVVLVHSSFIINSDHCMYVCSYICGIISEMEMLSQRI